MAKKTVTLDIETTSTEDAYKMKVTATAPAAYIKLPSGHVMNMALDKPAPKRKRKVKAIKVARDYGKMNTFKRWLLDSVSPYPYMAYEASKSDAPR